jgi:hypothetical protein
MATRGRRTDSTIALLKDRDRFKIVGWLAFVELGLGVYQAASLVNFLASDRPITTRSLDNVVMISTTETRHPNVDV